MDDVELASEVDVVTLVEVAEVVAAALPPESSLHAPSERAAERPVSANRTRGAKGCDRCMDDPQKKYALTEIPCCKGH